MPSEAKETRKMPSEAKETKEMPSEAKETKGVPSDAKWNKRKEKPSVAKQNNKRKGKSKKKNKSKNKKIKNIERKNKENKEIKERVERKKKVTKTNKRRGNTTIRDIEQIFRNLVPLLLMIIGLWNGVKSNEPNIGTLYDCQAAITKGIFAAPSEKRCRESFKSADLNKFNAEVRKYQVIRTVFPAYYCDAKYIVKECD